MRAASPETPERPLCCKDCGHRFTRRISGRAWVEGPAVPCPRCKGTDLRTDVRVGHDPKVLEGISKFRGKAAVCNSLPLHYPGADAYTPEGKPVFTTLRSQAEAGKRFGLEMV